MVFRQFDVFHVHWLDKVYWNASGTLATWNMISLTVLVRYLALRGTKVVWTVHDPSPHEISANAFMHTWFGRQISRIYFSQIIRSVSGLIFLSEEHIDGTLKRFPHFRSLPRVVMPHPHYIGSYPNDVSRAQARDKLGITLGIAVISFVGQLRPYKNVEALIRAFREFIAPEARLVIAGKPDSEQYERILRELVQGDARIRLEARFVPDQELQFFINAADVLVLPFRKATNSGSVALALSFDRPTAVPDIPVFREVRDIVGNDWLYLFDGELTGEHLDRILMWTRETPRPAHPPLEELSWERAATRTLDFYAKLVGARQ